MQISNKITSSIAFDYDDEIELAFRLGLIATKVPEWFLEGVQKRRSWTEPKADMEISIISDTADSWHEGYRAMRELGWQRTFVERKGGVITYVLEMSNPEWPVGYQTISTAYGIYLQTCKQVKTGTKEVDVFETVCEDLAEPVEGDDNSPSELDIDPATHPSYKGTTTKPNDDIPF